MNEETIKILEELSKEMDIKIEILSYGWIFKLSKGDKVHYITGNFDINKTPSSKIASDKYATYEVLKTQNISVINHVMIFNPEERKNYIKENNIWDVVENEFKKQGKLVIKPNYGYEGKDVFLCKTIDDVRKIVKYLLKKNTSISICPFYEIKKEYRAFYLDGEILLIYEKEKPFVIGNGKDKIKDLIKDLRLPHNEIVRNNLSKMDLEYVPRNSEKIELSWKHNLHGGATAKVLKKDDDIYKKIEELAIKAGSALDITFATIDIINTNNNELYVLEINSGVATGIFSKKVENGRKLAKDMYRKVLEKVFEI